MYCQLSSCMLREPSSHRANLEGAGPSSSAGLQLAPTPASANGGALEGAPLVPSAPPLPLSLMEHISGYDTLHNGVRAERSAACTLARTAFAHLPPRHIRRHDHALRPHMPSCSLALATCAVVCSSFNVFSLPSRRAFLDTVYCVLLYYIQYIFLNSTVSSYYNMHSTQFDLMRISSFLQLLCKDLSDYCSSLIHINRLEYS